MVESSAGSLVGAQIPELPDVVGGAGIERHFDGQERDYEPLGRRHLKSKELNRWWMCFCCPHVSSYFF